MKVIDEKGRLFGKLNVIDLLALLLAAAVAVFLVMKLAMRWCGVSWTRPRARRTGS